MSYLLIQNPGISPPACYTLLGLSTSRDVAGTIGQFGSGAKHAINVLLRNKLQIIIYCGTEKLVFTTRQDTVNDGLTNTPVDRVLCNGVDMGWCLGFGAIDWTETAMALREFVSNALDRSFRESGKPVVKIIETVRAKAGHTRVFVELNADVQQFYGELPKRFLHFSGVPLQTLMPKANRNLKSLAPMIYKHGVLVREVSETDAPSLYDYNFEKNLRLDESRNASEWEIRYETARAFQTATVQQLVPIFKSLLADEDTYEASLASDQLAPSWGLTDEQKTTWQEAWEVAAGPNAVLCDALYPQNAAFVARKGYVPKTTRAASWVSAARRCGIKTASDVLDEHETNGKVTLPATAAAIEATATAWGWFKKLGLASKAKPEVACFRDTMKGESTCFGYRAGDTVYYNESIATGMNKFLLQVAVEEVAHYLTDATDMSRDFQSFLIQAFVESQTCESVAS